MTDTATKPPKVDFSGKSVKTPVLPCGAKPVDPIVKKQLKCWDVEESGARDYDADSGQLHIVQKKRTDEVTITYTGPKIPPALTVKRDGVTIAPAKGGGTYQYPVSFTPRQFPYAGIGIEMAAGNKTGAAAVAGAAIWDMIATWSHEPTIYIFSHPDLPRSIEVRVYNPDQWKFSYDPPPARTMKLGARLDNKSISVTTPLAKRSVKSQTLTFTKESSKGGFFAATDTHSIEASYKTYVSKLETPSLWATVHGSKMSYEEKSEQPKGQELAEAVAASPPIKLECNGKLVKCNVTSIIGAILDLIKTFEEIVKLIKDFKNFAPEFGWYLDIDTKFFDGEIALTWGWREDTDFRAYYCLGTSIKIVLFEVSLELGVGVKVGPGSGQICANITGSANYELKPFETRAPSTLSKPQKSSLGALNGELTAGLYARAKAGSVFNFKAGVEVPLKVAAAFTLDEHWKFESKVGITCEGLKAVLTCTVMFYDYTGEAVLLEGGTLGSFTFPGPEHKEGEDFKNEKEVGEFVESIFSEGWWPILFYDSFKRTEKGILWGTNEVEDKWDVEASIVAEKVAQKIWAQRKHTEMNYKVVEGIAHSVRKKCEVLGETSFGRDKVALSQVSQYLDGSEFKTVLTNAQSPHKVYRQMLKQG